MKRNLIIQSSTQGLDIALIEDDKLVEFHQDVANKEYQVGDIYIGKVKKVLPGLNAAFIDIGYEKNAFLHYHDLGPQFKNINSFTQKVLINSEVDKRIEKYKGYKEIPKNGTIDKVLNVGQNLAVQIIKEPISTKGHRISAELTLAGRYIVLMPFSDAVSISKKIRNKKERKRLTNIFTDLKPDNFGVIIRTAAEERQVHLLERDFRSLLKRWENITKNLSLNKTKLFSEFNKATTIIRDILNDSFNSIIIDDKDTYEEIKTYVEKILPNHDLIIKFYNDKEAVFKKYNIEKQLKSLFGKIINFGRGAYLVVEKTEAMYVVDINSGSKNTHESNREDNVLKVNLEAADEIARILRLRDIGGLIVVDFIDMKKPENRRTLFEKMKTAMRSDRTQHLCLPLSKFGLMEITRQRVKPAIELANSETCPVCKGSGEIKPTILVIDDIEHSLNFIKSELKVREIVIKVHPFVYTYLKRKLISTRLNWMLKYKMRIRIKSSEVLQLIDYEICDKKGKDLEEF
ncbi:MAG: Rne/Rng family ribonuclease [Bacteroidota bacterium]|nr:Rne/Rng family ribonuclease [Bacteroidota bacterium]